MQKIVAFTSVGQRALPNLYDLLALALVFGLLIAVVHAGQGALLPLKAAGATDIHLAVVYLPYYALRTTLRMFVALGLSLVFTFTYATLAAKSERAEKVLIPLLDVLQSVPILGFLAFLVVFFVNLFPGSVAGYEAAAIFAIFTSQAWNMAFSFYQSLRNVPADLIEVSRGLDLSPWQRFWQLETPFAMPGLVWNMMMSMSGGWFFVVASEAITVGDNATRLPGIGSYIDLANARSDYGAVLAAVVTMGIVILAYDQLLFRPLVAFASRFRVEMVASQAQERSWAMDMFLRTRWSRPLMAVPARAFRRVALLSLRPSRGRAMSARSSARARLAGDLAFYAAIAAAALVTGTLIVRYLSTAVTWGELGRTIVLTTYTMIRVFVLVVLATLVWVPVGIWIGLRPKLAARIQPLAQFLAAFPANVVFPIAVLLLVAFSLDPQHLAQRAHHLRHAMVHPVQCHRRRPGLSQRSPGGVAQLRHPRPGLVVQGDAAGHLPLLRDGCADRVRRVLERRHRRRVRQGRRQDRDRAGDRLLHRHRHPARRLPGNRAGRRGHERLRHRVQPPALAPAVRARRAAPPSRLRAPPCCRNA